MFRDDQILKRINSNDRVRIRHYIEGYIIADDTAVNLLNREIYKQGFTVHRLGVEDGCLLLEIFK